MQFAFRYSGWRNIEGTSWESTSLVSPITMTTSAAHADEKARISSRTRTPTFHNGLPNIGGDVQWNLAIVFHFPNWMLLLTPTEIWLSQTQIDNWKLYALSTSIIHNASHIEPKSIWIAYSAGTRFHGGNLTNLEKVELMKLARSLGKIWIMKREAQSTLISRQVNVN